MADVDRCPSCDKPVQSRMALLDHLEFGHSIEDPVGHLLELEDVPRRKYDRRPMLAWAGVVAVILGAVVGGIVALSGAGPDDADLASASADPVAVAPTTTTTTTTAAVPPPPADAAPIEAPPSSPVPSTSAVPSPTTAPSATTSRVPVASFRKPFLGEAHVVSCTTVGAEDVYVVGFTFSGARDIVLGGQAFLGGSGDGAHELRHTRPAGSTGWLDRVVVADGGGDGHVVPITPPLHLGGCSA